MSPTSRASSLALLFFTSLSGKNRQARASCFLSGMSKKRLASNSPTKAKHQKQASLTGFFAAKKSLDSCTDSQSFKIFCDLDGVLCDFDAGVRQVCNNQGPEDFPSVGHMWKAIARADSFYANLPWTQDGRDLWEAILPLQPNVLTGVPMHKRAREEKAAWCRRELGENINHVDMAGPKRSHSVVQGRRRKGHVNVITCWSRNKYHESGPRAYV